MSSFTASTRGLSVLLAALLLLLPATTADDFCGPAPSLRVSPAAHVRKVRGGQVTKVTIAVKNPYKNDISDYIIRLRLPAETVIYQGSDLKGVGAKGLSPVFTTEDAENTLIWTFDTLPAGKTVKIVTRVLVRDCAALGPTSILTGGFELEGSSLLCPVAGPAAVLTVVKGKKGTPTPSGCAAATGSPTPQNACRM